MVDLMFLFEFVLFGVGTLCRLVQKVLTHWVGVAWPSVSAAMFWTIYLAGLKG